MNERPHPAMFEATRLTRAGRLAEATALLRRVLGGGETRADDAAAGATADATNAPAGRAERLIDVTPATVEVTHARPSSRTGHAVETEAGGWPAAETAEKIRPHIPEALRGFLDRLKGIGPEPEMGRPAPAPVPADVVPDGGRFVERSYSNRAGSRAYKLYIPSGYRGQPVPLVVMLHGCTQSPDDFAAGTRMNTLAEEHTCLVAYPAQDASASASRCWNWFDPGNQRHGQGEPSLIAGITRQVMRDYSVDPRRVYVAGLSAGGAAAAIMGMTYPDLYAAIGVHSGLACGVASDLPSAFAAMRQGNAGAAARRSAGDTPGAGETRRIVPTIVFHGDQDTTVHPRNGDLVIVQSRTGGSPSAGLRTTVQHGRVPGGRAYSRTLHADADGRAVLEQWVIHGAGHAWSGGSAAGSYTDPKGPDAAREMLRFFLDHPHSTAASRIRSDG
jgi:poly(hydroxyalkanoate) depolymerase family esterase